MRDLASSLLRLIKTRLSSDVKNLSPLTFHRQWRRDLAHSRAGRSVQVYLFIVVQLASKLERDCALTLKPL